MVNIMRLSFLKNKAIVFLYYMFRIFPIKKNKIVLCNFYGKGYGDSLKYLAQELIDYPVDMVWLLSKTNKKGVFPPAIRVIKYPSIHSIYELVTAKIWIDNSRKTQNVRKRKSQIYIQTWHGGIALKKIEFDVVDGLSDKYLLSAKRDTLMTDYMVSNSCFCTLLYKRAFKYEGEIWETGLPRNDVFFRDSNRYKQKINDYYHLANRKIVLYAPTFRKDRKIEKYDLDFGKFIERLCVTTGERWCALIRLHPDISKGFEHLHLANTVNVTDYPDMYELLAAADLLITDYSSTMFEFGLSFKPVILYANDVEEYMDERGMYFDFYSLPFPKAHDNQSLLSLIDSGIPQLCQKDLMQFYNELGIFESGCSSVLLAQNIISILKLKG